MKRKKKAKIISFYCPECYAEFRFARGDFKRKTLLCEYCKTPLDQD